MTNSQDITVQTLDMIFAVRPSANIRKRIQLTLSHICISVLVLYQHDDLFGDFVILGMFYCFHTFNVYQAFNFRKIKHLFMVSARFCETYFTLQELLYTFNKVIKAINNR